MFGLGRLQGFRIVSTRQMCFIFCRARNTQSNYTCSAAINTQVSVGPSTLATVMFGRNNFPTGSAWVPARRTSGLEWKSK